MLISILLCGVLVIRDGIAALSHCPKDENKDLCLNCGTAAHCHENGSSRSTFCSAGKLCLEKGNISTCTSSSEVPQCETPEKYPSIKQDPYGELVFMIFLQEGYRYYGCTLEGMLEGCSGSFVSVGQRNRELQRNEALKSKTNERSLDKPRTSKRALCKGEEEKQFCGSCFRKVTCKSSIHTYVVICPLGQVCKENGSTAACVPSSEFPECSCGLDGYPSITADYYNQHEFTVCPDSSSRIYSCSVDDLKWSCSYTSERVPPPTPDLLPTTVPTWSDMEDPDKAGAPLISEFTSSYLLLLIIVTQLIK